MISFRLTRMALVLMGTVVLCGCFPTGSDQSSEERESHFLAGRARVNAMDYTGAIEAFEKALEVNPHSASAHFELGWLYEDKQPDPATAIYHYQQYLKLRPNADNAEIIKQHIFRLKQVLAEAVSTLSPTPGVAREMARLEEENRQLGDEVERWRAYYASRGAAPTNTTRITIAGGRGQPTGGGARLAPDRADQRSQVVIQRPAVAAASRTHTVKAGDTLMAIARRYGVKLEALRAANPGLNPRRLQIGQSLNVPPP